MDCNDFPYKTARTSHFTRPMSLSDLITSFVLLGVGTFLMWNIPTPKRRNPSTEPSPTECPSVSVIIPARNEAHRIGPLLASLKRQTYPSYEVIIVDDGSQDQTVAVVQQAGFNVIASEEVPSGWQGKNWACWRGVQHSRGEILIFLDADVWLEDDGVESLVRAYQRHGGLLTVQPYHVAQNLYEQLSAPFNIVLMAALNAFTPLGDHLKPKGGFGPCLVCSREDYERIGGHSTVRLHVLEDIALAQVFSRSGLPVHCYGGAGTISFRMYPGGLNELIEGWGKGFAKGAGSVRPLFTLLAGAWVYGCFGAFINLIRAILTYGALPIGLGLLLYGLYAGQIYWMLKRIGRFQWWTSVLYPLPFTFFAVIMIYSLAITYVRRRVSWKGRTIRV